MVAEKSGVTSDRFPVDPQRPASWVESRGEVLRELPGRRVYRATAGGVPVVVKEYSPRRLRRWLRSYAETEAANALEARTRGVDVVEPLAWARLADGRQILILKEEEGARSLQDLILNAPPTGRARHELARSVGRLVAKMQNEGFRHGDPHAGNLLLRPDGSVLLADAGDLKPGSYLTCKERAADLARFAPFFFRHGNRIDLLLFWGAYARTSGLVPDVLEELRARVIERVPHAFRRLSRSRARRARRHGIPIRTGDFSGIAVRDIAEETLERIGGLARDLRPGDHVVKRSRTAWTLVVDGLIVKVFLPKKATRGLRDFVMGTRAERALLAAEALLHRGLRTPAVLATLRSRDGTRSILVMERITDSFPLAEVVAGLSASQAKAAAARIGRTLRRMHDWGLRHRDLKQQNLLLDRAGERICFLDMDGVRQTANLDWDRRLKDLANLDGSMHDFCAIPTGLRLRALDAYLRGAKRPEGFVRRLIAAAARQRERRAGLS
ncbi:MAG: AarF/UbiB family protein [Planctomycetota bacterium]|nr:AarF/UbiB family protein [Planctomycetota bacterium]